MLRHWTLCAKVGCTPIDTSDKLDAKEGSNLKHQTSDLKWVSMGRLELESIVSYQNLLHGCITMVKHHDVWCALSRQLSAKKLI